MASAEFGQAAPKNRRTASELSSSYVRQANPSAGGAGESGGIRLHPAVDVRCCDNAVRAADCANSSSGNGRVGADELFGRAVAARTGRPGYHPAYSMASLSGRGSEGHSVEEREDRTSPPSDASIGQVAVLLPVKGEDPLHLLARYTH